MVKKDSFGLFGREGWRGGGGVGAKEEARGRGEERSPGEAGGRPAGASETTWSERRKETAAGGGVRVFGQQPPGVWSLSNTRDIRGLGFLWFGKGVRVFGFSGVCFVWGFGY